MRRFVENFDNFDKDDIRKYIDNNKDISIADYEIEYNNGTKYINTSITETISIDGNAIDIEKYFKDNKIKFGKVGRIDISGLGLSDTYLFPGTAYHINADNNNFKIFDFDFHSYYNVYSSIPTRRIDLNNCDIVEIKSFPRATYINLKNNLLKNTSNIIKNIKLDEIYSLNLNGNLHLDNIDDICDYNFQYLNLSYTNISRIDKFPKISNGSIVTKNKIELSNTDLFDISDILNIYDYSKITSLSDIQLYGTPIGRLIYRITLDDENFNIDNLRLMDDYIMIKKPKNEYSKPRLSSKRFNKFMTEVLNKDSEYINDALHLLRNDYEII